MAQADLMGVHDTHSGAQPDDDVEAYAGTADSRFDSFDGYYSVRFSGVEFARFAPSPVWSDYAKSMENTPDFSYAFVPTSPAVTVVEAKARLYEIDGYEGPDSDASDGDRAFWLTDAAKSAIGLLYLKYRHQPGLLLGGVFEVVREGDFMVARLAAPAEPTNPNEETK